MRRRLRGKLRGVQQNTDGGVTVDGGEVGLAIVREVGDREEEWIQTHAKVRG